MKTIFKSFAYAAAAALALASCAKENLVPNDGETGGKKLVKVNFGAETTDPASSRATLTPDEGETAFAAAWGNDDQIAITYTYVDLEVSEIVPGTWKDSDFSADITDMTTGDELATMSYAASYPYSQNGEVDFGSERTQSGGGYNSKYDIMVSTKVEATAKPGLDVNGNKIVFPMERQTAIAYFHFTSDNAEEDITKATLTVEGGSIAAGYALLDPSGFMPDLDSSPLSEIVLNVTGQKADDFTLWFNVLPTSYTKMTLTVETATKTFTISKNSEGMYEAGKLYKVKKEGIAWENKGEGKDYAYQKISSVEEYAPGQYIIVAHVYKDDCPTKGDFAIEKSLTIASNKVLGTDITDKIANDIISLSDGINFELTLSGDKDNIVISNGTNTLSYKSSTDLNLNGDNKIWSLSVNSGNGGTFKLLNKSTESVSTKRALAFQCYTTSGQTKTASLKFGAYAANNINNADYSAIELYKYQEIISGGAGLFTINFSAINGGTISSNVSSAEEGAEITLTAMPDEGYEFIENSWKVVAADDSEITVTDGKFIMPASDVTVTASFVRKSYLEAAPSKTTISADGETVTVTVDTNVDGGWTAESSDETNFIIGNKTATTFDVTVSKNETEAAREATITVTAGILTKTITMTQKAAGQGGDTPNVGTVLWEETWQGGTKDEIPANYGQEGTTVYGGYKVTYTSSNTGTKLFDDTTPLPTTNLLLKSKDTWGISGIPTGNSKKLTFTFVTNNKTTTRYKLSSVTSGITIGEVSISGTSSPFTVTSTIEITGSVETFDLSISNTTSSNIRLDDLKIVVAE